MNTSLVADWVVLVIALGYGVAAWLVQMHRVAPPRDWLLERIWFINDQVAGGRWRIAKRDEDAGAKLEGLAKIEKSVSRPWLVVPVSKVQAGWRYVHGVEDDHSLELTPELVDEKLATARNKLKGIRGKEAASLVERIDKLLKESGQRHKEKAGLLQDAEAFRHNTNDTSYENAANLLGKAVWLIWISLAVVVGLAALFDRESYFLLGAAGGLISRLTRVLRRRPRASDYGAEWSTLLLSPAAGAVMGWVGVALAVALANDPFNVLSDDFANLWDDATAPLGLALAFLFGFSERFFDRLLARWETEVTGKLPTDDEADSGAKPATE